MKRKVNEALIDLTSTEIGFNNVKSSRHLAGKRSHNIICIDGDDRLRDIATEVVKTLIDLFPNRSTKNLRNLAYNQCTDNQQVSNVGEIVEKCCRILNNEEYIIVDDNFVVENRTSSSSHSNNNAKLSPLETVLEVFPDAKDEYVQALLSKLGNDLPQVLRDMAEKGYDRVEAKKPEPVLDFSSTAWETTEPYKASALVALQNDFPFLRMVGLKALFLQYKQHYAPTRDVIDKATGSNTNLSILCEPSNRRNKLRRDAVITQISPLLESLGLNIKTSANSKQAAAGELSFDTTLLKERSWYEKRLTCSREAEDRLFAEKVNEELAAQDGGLIECACCCTDSAFESIVQCSEGHLFCRQCLQRYAEQTLFGDGRITLRCMCTTETCEGTFSERMLTLALPEKEATIKHAVDAAKMDDLMTCHNCQLQVVLSTDAGKVLTCPRCAKQTCRECQEEAHVPLKCSEVEKKGHKDQRVALEEAMTKARLRQCFKCKANFYKTEGCNKMTCACGAFMCYICQQDLSKVGYAHFCQTPHCTHKECGKCVLYSNSVEDDRRAMYEAGLQVVGNLSVTAEGRAGGTGTTDSTMAMTAEQVLVLLEGGKAPVIPRQVPPVIPGQPIQQAMLAHRQHPAPVAVAAPPRHPNMGLPGNILYGNMGLLPIRARGRARRGRGRE
eukprot:gene3427-6798_t